MPKGPFSDETRRKMSESHVRRGSRPPGLNPSWSIAEDDLCRSLPPEEVVKQTGRTLRAVLARRRKLGVRSVYKVTPIRPRKPANKGRKWTPQEDEIVRTYPVEKAAQLVGVSKPSIYARQRLLGV